MTPNLAVICATVYLRLPSAAFSSYISRATRRPVEQLAVLAVAPERIYIDRGFSGTRRTNRTGLDQALAALWPGSILTVTKFDRFARDVADAHTILTDLSERGVLFGLG